MAAGNNWFCMLPTSTRTEVINNAPLVAGQADPGCQAWLWALTFCNLNENPSFAICLWTFLRAQRRSLTHPNPNVFFCCSMSKCQGFPDISTVGSFLEHSQLFGTCWICMLPGLTTKKCFYFGSFMNYGAQDHSLGWWIGVETVVKTRKMVFIWLQHCRVTWWILVETKPFLILL